MNTTCEDDDEDWCKPGSSGGSSRNSDVNDCIIHCSNAKGKLIKVTKLAQWNSLVDAARTKKYEVLLTLEAKKVLTFPENIYYHKNCRNTIILRAKRKEESEESETLPPDDDGDTVRRSKRKSELPRVLMPKTCIFCSALYKKKKDNTKEKSIKCRDLDAPGSINNAQEEKQSECIAHVLKNYDLLANEAHYHTSCYKKFTKNSSKKVINSVEVEISRETTLALEALEQLYDYIRTEIIEKKKIETMVSVMEKYCLFLGEKGLDKNIPKPEKRKVRKLLKINFENTVTMLQIDKTKLLLIPKTISILDLAVENYHLKDKLAHKKKSESSEDQVIGAAKILREEIIENKPNFSWPPQPSELNGENVNVPPLTQLFYDNLISGRDVQSDINSIKVKSFYQDVSYKKTVLQNHFTSVCYKGIDR